MARPLSGDPRSDRLIVRMKPSSMRLVRDLAKERGLSTSALVREALLQYIEKYMRGD